GGGVPAVCPGAGRPGDPRHAPPLWPADLLEVRLCRRVQPVLPLRCPAPARSLRPGLRLGGRRLSRDRPGGDAGHDGELPQRARLARDAQEPVPAAGPRAGWLLGWLARRTWSVAPDAG